MRRGRYSGIDSGGPGLLHNPSPRLSSRLDETEGERSRNGTDETEARRQAKKQQLVWVGKVINGDLVSFRGRGYYLSGNREVSDQVICTPKRSSG